jgi:transcriptional regulator with XRE-family HTH domain
MRRGRRVRHPGEDPRALEAVHRLRYLDSMYEMRVSLPLRALRLAAALSQRDLAERLGTSQSAIARLERGRANPTVETLRHWAAATGHALRLAFAPLSPADPVVERYKRDVDRTLLRENLRRSVDERLRSLALWQDAGRELERAARAARAARGGRASGRKRRR